MARYIYYRLLGWLQSKCSHPPENVSYDITEGDSTVGIRWCRICGAYKYHGGRIWVQARADWWINE